VTPSWNSARFIEATLDSVRHQTDSRHEHIVVDGKSTDGTHEILGLRTDIVWLREPDLGQADAINRGFRRARGDILAWQNADDTYLPETFAIVAEYLTRHPEVGMVYGDYEMMDEHGTSICRVRPPEWNQRLFAHGRFVPMQPSTFWRRSVAEAVGELDPSLHFCMDVDFIARASRRTQVAYLPELLGRFRMHGESKTQERSQQGRVAAEHWRVLSREYVLGPVDHLMFRAFQLRGRLVRLVRLGRRWM
jgi:glycosyltransferase involved in cell wall biosynthesis